jgi:CRISPR/Cas system-associated endonuclease Cas1
MKPLVLTAYDWCLKVRNGKLVLFDQATRELREWAPAEFPYDTVVCDPLGSFVTFPALRWLAERRAVLTLLNFNGRPILTALPDHPINGRERIAQLSAHIDPEKRLEIAKTIVAAKTGCAVPEQVRSRSHLLMWEAQQAEAYWRALGIVRDYPHARDPKNLAINYSFGLLESAAR